MPTSILNLNWAEAVSEAHQLDGQLQQIVSKSNEGFAFKIDLQVQIHVPDTKAPRVISMVGTMRNLVNEVVQAAVGNHIRDKLQSMPAIRLIETRQQVQVEAFEHIPRADRRKGSGRAKWLLGRSLLAQPRRGCRASTRSSVVAAGFGRRRTSPDQVQADNVPGSGGLLTAPRPSRSQTDRSAITGVTRIARRAGK